MMKSGLSAVILLTATAIMAQTPNQATSADQFRDLATSAKNSGDLPAEANYLCQAAALDSKKYEKRCTHAREDVGKALVQFKIDLDTGRTEIQQKNYAGALRDLEKITFGSNKEEAKDLIQLVRIASNGGTPADLVSYDAFSSARIAYSRGNFDLAQSEAKLVKSAPLQNTINKLLTNINVYRDLMRDADALVKSGDLKGAEQKYQLAALIKQDGPGQPQDRLREVQAAEAQAASAKAALPLPPPVVPPPNGSKSAPSPNTGDSPDKNKAISDADSQKQRLKKDAQRLRTSLQAKDGKAENASGAKGASEEVKRDSEMTKKELTQGITDFYASHFSSAADAIEVYLQGDGAQYLGAAHFYLGASLLMQAFLTSPKDTLRIESLRNQAQTEFMAAKRLHYKPVVSAVSPKVFGEWTQIGNQQ
jgi:hypothetical protein